MTVRTPHFVESVDALRWWMRELDAALDSDDPAGSRAALLRILDEGEAHLWTLSGEPGKGHPQRWTLRGWPTVRR
jgi:hypothetical protein